MSKIKYSIVIPMFNEGLMLDKCLGSIINATENRDDIEIIIVDNGSTDGCDQKAVIMGAEVIYQTIGNISALRNTGANNAKGEFLLFLDADMEVYPTWFEDIDKYFSELEGNVFGFMDFAPKNAPWFARRWHERCLNRRNGIKLVDDLPGRNIYVKKSSFDAINGFDESLMTGEDKDLIMRLITNGETVYSVYPPHITHWGYEKTFKEWIAKEYWRQHNHPELIIRHNFSLRVLRFPIIALAILFFAVLALLVPKLFIPSLLVSLLPSIVLTLKHKHSRKSIAIALQFILLYWLRFLTSAVSIIVAIVKLALGK